MKEGVAWSRGCGGRGIGCFGKRWRRLSIDICSIIGYLEWVSRRDIRIPDGYSPRICHIDIPGEHARWTCWMGVPHKSDIPGEDLIWIYEIDTPVPRRHLYIPHGCSISGR